MIAVDASTLAIATAAKASTLRLVERASRFAGETFVAIEDDRGTIEVVDDMAAAVARVAAVRQRVA